MKHGEPSVLGFHFVEQEVWIQLSPPAPPVAPGKGTYVRRSISLRISRTIKFIFRRPQTVLLTPQRKFIVAHRPERLNSGPHLNCYPSVTNCVFQRSTGSATATRNLAAAEQQSDKPGKSSSPVKSPLHKGCRTEQSREKITACILSLQAQFLLGNSVFILGCDHRRCFALSHFPHRQADHQPTLQHHNQAVVHHLHHQGVLPTHRKGADHRQ